MSFQKNPPWQKNVPIQNFQQLQNLQGLQFNQQQLSSAAFQNYQNQQNQFANLATLPIQYPAQIPNQRVNINAFQQHVPVSQPQQQQQQPPQSKYNTNFKTFSGTGVVTKIQNDIGFIDDEVLFHKNVCVPKDRIPKLRDLVLVEASYNSKMPFKWNATRVQVLTPMNSVQDNINSNNGNFLRHLNFSLFLI